MEQTFNLKKIRLFHPNGGSVSLQQNLRVREFPGPSKRASNGGNFHEVFDVQKVWRKVKNQRRGVVEETDFLFNLTIQVLAALEKSLPGFQVGPRFHVLAANSCGFTKL